ncbi:MAG TPA: ABC transporter ATP-binding protein [Candidatus Norongarragalinales archaeon]|nr:ABC transporter ATP-binding protein [Candidatus Norongarragalinales archaeon]
MKSAIEIRDLTVKYGKYAAVENCSLEIYENEIFGILGPNGAGKSSIMKVITGQVSPYSGGARVWGLDISSNRGEMKKLIGFVPQEYSFGHDFTVGENIDYLARLYGISGPDLAKRTEEQLSRYLLKDRINQRAGDLSGGYKRLLNFALSTIHSPKLLLLDEPTVGLDPDIRTKVWDIISGLREAGHTQILTTHYLEEATFLCDRLAIIYKGKILVTGTPSSLISQYGGETKIFVVLSKAAESIVPDIRKIRGVTSCSSNNDVLISSCLSRDVFKVVSAMNRLIDDEGLEIRENIVKEPTLDDVFKSIVGAELGVK